MFNKKKINIKVYGLCKQSIQYTLCFLEKSKQKCILFMFFFKAVLRHFF